LQFIKHRMEALGQTRLPCAVSGSASAPRPRPLSDLRSLLRVLAWFLSLSLLLCGTWLLVRRLTGSFAAPLGAGPLVAVGALAVIWAVAARLIWRHAADLHQPRWHDRAMEWTPTVALVLIATSIVMPESSLAAVILLWTMIAAEESGAALLWRWPKPAPSAAGAAKPRSWGIVNPRDAAQAVAEMDEAELSPELRQQQTRTRKPNGSEAIEGTLRVVFATGQRVAIEHIAFCPLLAKVPAISAMILNELEGSVRATHVYRYGARLEVKLREPCDEAAEVVVEYNARG
jgi:hypothetical protein